MTNRAATVLLCAWLSVAATPAKRQPVVPAPTGAPLANVTLIDGRGGAPREHQTVVIRDGRIAELGPSAATRIPPGAQVLDLAGRCCRD
jgi:enamidase